jgi:hypothetical protein
MSHHVDTLINTLHNRYDPEHDIIPGTPMVTYTDYALLQIVVELKERIDRLEADMTDLTEQDNPCE